ncbi:putative disease resistance RPP13-like protein 1 [Citrus sinensis]|nr:putative disease resistance RPP13-like protein 1 [Citrus sinensis]
MSFIGEAVLTVSVELLIEKLASEGLELFTRHEKLRADFIEWKGMLEMIQAVLADAEDRQTKDKAVKKWLDNLQNLAYDAEDVLDELETEALRRELLLQEPPAPYQPSTSTSKFRKIIPTCCTNFSPRSIQFESKMVSKIEEVTGRLQSIISTQKDLLTMKNVISDGKSGINVGQRLPTTSLVNEAEVYGREKDKEAIVELLLRDDSRADDGFSVISIKGLGGVGKTTLAQLVYQDERVQRHFQIKSWTCVFEDFDVFRVSKLILNSIASDQCTDKDDLNLLQEKLKKQLSGKKFLVVLDDVWNENYNSWRALSCPFGAGAFGSKIVVTHRNQGVAETMRAVSTKTLKELSDDDCLRVLIQHSLGARDFNIPQSLKEVAEKIVKKCKGLPLAAKTLGGLLRGKDDLNDWEFLLNANIWDLQEDKCDIVPALRVSYHFLPPQLKQCFAYFSLFPKDYDFQEEEIILLWTAEGFLDQEYNGRKMEDLGREFVRELHSRSLVQQSSKNASRFVMHDLINDLSRWAAGELYFRIEDTLAGENRQKFSQSLRHFSYIHGEYDGEKRLKSVSDVERLRTFLPVNLSDYRRNYLAWSVLQRLLNLPRLRVFSLHGYHISKLPNEIGNLKHLRFLNLSRTNIQILPESINSLYNLHTILLEDCRRLKKLCKNMGNLMKLHHLRNPNVHSLEEMPKGFGKLTCLLTLSRFVVGKDSGSGLRELKSLMHLQGTLQISKLENVKDVGDASEAQLNTKVNLKALLLEWRDWNRVNQRRGNLSDVMELDFKIEIRVLDMLKPHQKLEELTIAGYGGTKFPTWLGDSSFSKLMLLRFEGCGMCTSLPSVGQLPLLKHLEISRMDTVKSVGPEFYGNSCSVPFPSLETLCFKDMQEWEEWIPCGSGREGFPKLRMLSLVRCSKLQGSLPERLTLLETLAIKSCEQLLVTIHCLPALRELQMDGCKRVVFSSPIDLSSLKSVVLRRMPGLFEKGLPKLANLKIGYGREQTYLWQRWQSETQLLQDISSLKRLQISGCPQIFSLVTEEVHDQQQPELQCRLELSHCEDLTKLPQALLTLTALREMRIDGCASLVSFSQASLPSQLRKLIISSCGVVESLPEAWRHNSDSPLQILNIRLCGSLVSFPEVALPSQLRAVRFIECKALESLPEAWMQNSNTSLESLKFKRCDSLTYIARIQLSPSLKRLIIKRCPNLRTLTLKQDIRRSSSGSTSLTPFSSENELPDTLEHLEVTHCSNLAFLSWNGNLPRALKYLYVKDCSKLESLADRLDNTSLEEITISCLENLKSLPDGLHNLHHLQRIWIFGCPNFESFPEGGLPSTKLTRLTIWNCKNLKALPNCMHNLTSLLHLEIRECPSLVSFPEDGFPTNLQSLVVDDLKISKPLFEWGLDRLASLRELRIRGGCPDLVLSPRFPASLIQLGISDMPNLKRLSSIGENLTPLETLDLNNCPKLKYFSKQGLPKSLLRLDIDDCPLMEKRCRNDKRKYWPMIKRVPYVSINDRLLF